MSQHYAQLISMWKDADDAAYAAQEELDFALENFIRRDAPLPSEEQRLRVRDLRANARERLAVALLSITKSN